MKDFTSTEIVVIILIAGFVGCFIGMLVTAAFYELKNIIEKRDNYDETF